MSTTKRQLLKLSKVALIEECKKYKVSATGTKSDMIDRILAKCRPQKTSTKDTIDAKQNKTKVSKSKTIRGLPFKTRKLYLTTGYIRKELLKQKANDNLYDYDSSVSMVIIAYIGSIFLKFDAYHDKYKKKCIREKGMKIIRGEIMYQLSGEERRQMSDRKNNRGGGRRTKVGICSEQSAVIPFGSKCGFSGKEDIYKWKIRLKSDDQYVYDYIGVTDNIDLCDMELIRRTDTDLELLNKHVKPYCIHTSSSGLAKSKFKEVKITLDFKNECVAYRFGTGASTQNIKQRIEKDKTYYMIIVSCSDGAEYRLSKN